ncbi:50S ribosomal protein L7/L12 [Acetilactobacillus jinshanensis]|uniref:Large ribosomal subunit protein bL12 n=1 Tax=Acetilactobacillus jinshanensis TaxID=1720083 RepID=A0A4P6ZN34_9LACO|nr:50S ribosomal protein L7/L12 [Acetilactobacillus jinshanensis]QBP18842.1 50S ribosomal protein L7/L12 [Acetilactobacillus jinshanensis]URL61709.1 50S ribosomal protein L7/L12 [uncultured bacterium]
MAFDKDNIISQLKEAKITDLNDLVKSIEKEFGVKAAVAAAPAAGGNGNGAAAKSAFDVELTQPGAAKIKAIKAVHDITGKGLKDSKDLVDGAPSILKKGVKKADAAKMKKTLEAAGCTVTLK